jgi:hypothetical protein
MNNTNRLISGDNKGVAEQLAERWARRNQGAAPGFVAAFAQSNVGDASPNVQGAFCVDTGESVGGVAARAAADPAPRAPASLGAGCWPSRLRPPPRR